MRSIGAYSNILSGHGTALDYVKFFRDNPKLSKRAGSKIGLFGRGHTAGKAFIIAKYASDWLFDMLVNEKLNEAETYSIVTATKEESWQ